MLATIAFPSWLKPEVIPGLPFRWYGLTYAGAIAITWFLFVRESRRRKAPWTDDEAAGLFVWAVLGLLIGARLLGTLGYAWATFIKAPWSIIWPFDQDGAFIGLRGMSYHGGFLGAGLASLAYARRRGINWLAWADVMALCAPLGYTLGRLGNFLNGELWGKVSDRPWAMVFPGATAFSAREPWVQEFANKVGISVSSMNDMVNLPRHPTQLYEALLEGLVLWAVLWLFVRRRPAFPGLALACYTLGYGLARFGLEYLRDSEAYVLRLGPVRAQPEFFAGLGYLSLGQVLSLAMVLGAGAFLFFASRSSRRPTAL